MLQKLAYIVASLALPIAWGIAVNWLFNLWQERAAGERPDEKRRDEPIFPDFQI